MLNTWERDFLAEVKARVLARQPVSLREKQIVLDLVRRENIAMSQKAYAAAEREGLNLQGIAQV